MSAIIVVLLLATAMAAMIWVARSGRSRSVSIRERALPGQLSAAERRRLYERLGIDPIAMARQRKPTALWRDPRLAARPPACDPNADAAS